MSIQAIAWVLANSEAEGNDRLVLLAIANHANDEGSNAYPSVERIATEARVSRSTVFRALARLEDLGELVIVRDRGRGNPNWYVVPVDRKGVTVTPFSGVKGVTGETKKVSPQQIKGVTGDTQTVSNRHLTARTRSALPDTSPLTDAERQRGKAAVVRLRGGLGR